MDKEEIFYHYSAILDELLHTPFYEFYFQNPYPREYGVYLDFGQDLEMNFGASRGCLIDRSYDWVVKFSTTFNEGKEYCENEVRYYKEALKRKMDCYFVECEFVGGYKKKIKFFDWRELGCFAPNDEEDEWLENAAKSGIEEKEILIEVPLYAYRKVKEPNVRYRLSKEEIKLGNSLKSPIAEFYIETAIALWNEYGETEFWRIDNFCRTFCINDLHCGNLGRLDGRLVICDFAGNHG